MAGEIIKGSIKTYAPEGLDVVIYGKNRSGVRKVVNVSQNPLSPSPGFNVLCVGGNSGHNNTDLLPLPINIDNNSHTGLCILGTSDQTQQSSPYLNTLPINDTSGENNVNVIDKNSNKISGGGNGSSANINPFKLVSFSSTTSTFDTDMETQLSTINASGFTVINHTVTLIVGSALLVTIIYTAN
jgi:hypothetical protein